MQWCRGCTPWLRLWSRLRIRTPDPDWILPGRRLRSSNAPVITFGQYLRSWGRSNPGWRGTTRVWRARHGPWTYRHVDAWHVDHTRRCCVPGGRPRRRRSLARWWSRTDDTADQSSITTHTLKHLVLVVTDRLSGTHYQSSSGIRTLA